MQCCMRALRRMVQTFSALALVIIVAARPAYAQAGELTGTVVDSKSGLPIADAQVLVEGTELRARTNLKGEFRLSGVTGAVRLIVTGIGFQPTTVNASAGATALRVALTEYAVKLEEVIVTGTVGDAQRRSLGNVIGKVDVSSLVQQAPPTKIQDMLSVNVPGVRIQRSSGGVGSGGITRIRGSGSLSLGNEPLIYVDGIRVNNQGAVANEASFTDSPSRINDLNPEEIESIEVLKGPSAATIYGTEASNGVIQIITKKGRTGRPTWDVRLEGGANWLHNPDGRYQDVFYYSQTEQQVLPFDVLENNRRLGYPEVFSTGTPMGAGASLNGGSETVRYHVSGDYARDEGPVEYNWQNKLSGRANVSYTGNKFTADVSLGIVRSKLRGASTAQPITTSIIWACPIPGCEPDPASPDNTGWNGPTRGFIAYRPEDYDLVEGFLNVDRTTLSVRLAHRPTSWLRHNLTVGPDFVNDRSTSHYFKDPTGYNAFGPASNGFKSDRQARSTYVTVDYGASAEFKPSSNMVFTTSVGAQYYHKSLDEVYAQGEGFSIPGPSDVNGSTIRSGSENFVENKTFGVYAQEQFAWKNRVFLTAALRADDNSAFGENFSAAYYPKFSASWVLSDEPFLSNSGFLSQLRVRGAWGRAGQQPDIFSSIQTYRPVVGFSGLGGVTPQNVGNPNLKPEIGEEIELGLDAGLFNGKVGIEFTYYDKKVQDAILTLPIKPSTGFPGTQFVNIGGTQNTGIELALDASPINKEGFGLDLRLTYATNDGKITDLGGTPPSLTTGAGSYIQQYYVEGYAPGSYFYKRVVSSDIVTVPVAGVPLPIGTNVMCEGGTDLGDGDGSAVSCDDAPRIYHGRPTPSWNGSFSANLRLGKSLQLLGLLDFIGGSSVLVGDVVGVHQFFLNSEAILKGTSEVLSGQLGAQLTGDDGRTWGASALMKSGFLKLRTVAATYELPRSVAGWIGATRGSFTLSGENLAILWREQKDSYGAKWIDPEILANYPGATNPTGNFAYTQESWPQTMRIRATVRLTF
jgi:TonB-linked SusC/RagA family outer membrane protein